jgi:hypothetical protein
MLDIGQRAGAPRGGQRQGLGNRWRQAPAALAAATALRKSRRPDGCMIGILEYRSLPRYLPCRTDL